MLSKIYLILRDTIKNRLLLICTVPFCVICANTKQNSKTLHLAFMRHIINIHKENNSMSQTHKHAIPANIADRCLINPGQYETKYKRSNGTARYVLGRTGKILGGHAVPKVKNLLCAGNVSIKWYGRRWIWQQSCLDRHLQENGDRTRHYLGRR